MVKRKSSSKKTAKKKTAKKTVKRAKPKRKAAPRKKPAAAKKPRAAAKPAQEAPQLAWRTPLPGETQIGVVQDFFGHINVIAFVLEAPLAVGDKIHVRGHTTDLIQTVESMQANHQGVSQAAPKDAIGVKVSDRCRAGDYVYKVS